MTVGVPIVQSRGVDDTYLSAVSKKNQASARRTSYKFIMYVWANFHSSFIHQQMPEEQYFNFTPLDDCHMICDKCFLFGCKLDYDLL